MQTAVTTLPLAGRRRSFLDLDRVSVSFPIYNASTRSVKNRLLHMTTGGRIARTGARHVVVEALSDINLRLEHGERVGLIGHNGAGKTTLLRVMAGIYEPVTGRFTWQGRIAALLDIGLGIDPENTGYENIMMRGLFLGLSRAQIRDRVDEIAAFTELGNYLNMPVRTYSTGMMVRLNFAINTCIDADILLMDEWLSAGDARFTERARTRLTEMVDRAAIMVLASHSEALIRQVCTKAVLMTHGRIAAIGPVEDILRRYRQPDPAIPAEAG